MEIEIPEFGEGRVNYNDHFHNKADSIDTAKEVDKILREEAIEEALDTLNEREKTLLQLRFFDKLTYDAIGKVISRSQERVRQIIAKGLRKLRHPSRRDPLLQFWSHELYELKKKEEKEEEEQQQIKEKQRENERKAQIQRHLLFGLAEAARAEAEEEALAIDDKEKRRAFIARNLNKQELFTWWNAQMWHIRESIDFNLPAKRFTGKCECKDWNCEYHVNFDEVEVLCCECLIKFFMRNTKCQ